MIEIDQDLKKIFFYHTPEEIKNNAHRDENMYEFDLLSGFTCPECNKVIDAYYIGHLPIKDKSDDYSCHPYMLKSGYDRYYPHYKFGHKYGGGYLTMCNHNETHCKTHLASVGGIIEGIKSVISYIVPTPEIIPTEHMIKTFAANVFEKKIPGISFIEDVCGNRDPVLAINRKQFAKNISYNKLSEFDKEYKYNYLIYLLIIGDADIKIVKEEN